MHGTDVLHPRTRQATRAVAPLIDLLAAVSASLAHELPGRAARRRAQVLPCGVDLERFHPLSRTTARAQLGLDPERPTCSSRPTELAPRSVMTGRSRSHRRPGSSCSRSARSPELVPLWVNAANAVLVPSEREGFGLAVLEALACDVPVLATPVGIHPEALANVAGSLCAPFELGRWRTALEPHLDTPDPRVAGSASAARFSSRRMAERVAGAWRAGLEKSGSPHEPTPQAQASARERGASCRKGS